MQALTPQTIGYALTDSPVGQPNGGGDPLDEVFLFISISLLTAACEGVCDVLALLGGAGAELGVTDALETSAAIAEALSSGKSGFDVLGAEINAELGQMEQLAREAGDMNSLLARVADYLTEDPPNCLASIPAGSPRVPAEVKPADAVAIGGVCRFTVDVKGVINDLDGPQAQILINKAAGDGFRDDLAAFFRMHGRTVVTDGENKSALTFGTPYGTRTFDLEVRDGEGNLLGYVEAKTGGSPYSAAQQQKDDWLRQQYGFNIAVVRSVG